MGTRNEQVKKVIVDQGLSHAKFAQRLGVSPSGITKIVTGVNPVTDQMKTSICDAFGVNPDFIEGQTDEMYRKDDDLAQLLGKIFAGKNEFARSVLLAFAKLDQRQWDNLKDIMDTLKK